MEYREFRSFVEPGYAVDTAIVRCAKPQLEVCTLEISYAHVMKRTLELGFRDSEQDAEWDEDNRDLPDGFLHAVIQAVFETAGEALEEAFEDAIEEAAGDWGLQKREAPDAD